MILRVVTTLNEGDQILSELDTIVNNFHLLSLNISVRVGNVPRECNNLIHVIAKMSASSMCWADSFYVWFSDVASSDFSI